MSLFFRHSLLLAFAVVGMSLSTVAQQVLFKRYIQVTDTIDDGGVQLPVSSDDAEQENDEMDSLEDDDLDAGWEGDPADQNQLTTGLRFRDLSIPKGATIDSAFIVFSSHEAKTPADVADITIFGEASDFAATYDLTTLITDRPKTTASVQWLVAEDWGLWTTHQTVDIKAIVQEIIDRAGWQTGNPIAFVLEGKDQGVTAVENAREFESFENIADPADGGDGQNHPERVPQLFVYYTAPGQVDIFIAVTDTIDDGGVQLPVSSDDAEQENDEMDSLEDDDLDAGWEGDPADQNLLTTGLIFRNIPIGKGAQIDSAFIYVVSHEAKNADDVAEITIHVEDSDSAATFTLASLITDRPTLATTVSWNVSEPWGLWTEHRSPDLKVLVQAMVDRPGWKSGNAISFIMEGTNQGVTAVENAREFESYENISDPSDGGDGQNHPERVPRLRVYFNAATGIDRAEVLFGGLNVYPNPAVGGPVTVELHNQQPAEIKLYNAAGQLVLEQQTAGMDRAELTVSHLPNGSYFLHVIQGNQLFTDKLQLSRQ